MRLYITLILLAIIICPLTAMEPFDYNKEQKPLTLNYHVQYLEDKEKKFTIHEVYKKTIPWNDVKKNYIGFGFTSSTYWFKFCLNNKSDKTNNLYLEIDNPMLDSIELYIPQKSGQFELKKAGDLLPFNSRDVKDKGFIFLIKDTPGINEYYIRIESTSSLRFNIKLLSEQSYQNRPFDADILFYIALIALIVISLYLYASEKRISYIFYMIYIASFLLLQLTMSGRAFQYLWPQSVWMANNSMSLFHTSSFLFCGLFFRFYISEEKKNIITDIFIFLLLILPNIMLLIGIFFIKYQLIIRLIAGYFILFLIFLFFLSLVLSILKSKAALLFLISILVFVIGIAINFLQLFGILPTPFIAEWSLKIASVIAFIIQLPFFVKPSHR